MTPLKFKSAFFILRQSKKSCNALNYIDKTLSGQGIMIFQDIVLTLVSMAPKLVLWKKTGIL
jgi:hypothetical protein